MTAFKAGDVVSVEFPFSDLQTHKQIFASPRLGAAALALLAGWA